MRDSQLGRTTRWTAKMMNIAYVKRVKKKNELAEKKREAVSLRKKQEAVETTNKKKREVAKTMHKKKGEVTEKKKKEDSMMNLREMMKKEDSKMNPRVMRKKIEELMMGNPCRLHCMSWCPGMWLLNSRSSGR